MKNRIEELEKENKALNEKLREILKIVNFLDGHDYYEPKNTQDEMLDRIRTALFN